MICIRIFIKEHSWIVWIGLMTGGAVVLFRVISLFVIYRYMKLDYYLCLVAVCFGAAGWMLNKRRPAVETASLPAAETASLPAAETASLPAVETAPLPADVLAASPVSPPTSGKNLLTVLTSKEVLVLRLLAESKTNKEIAAELYVELSTVKTHINNIYTKLSVSNRKEARSKYAEMAQRFPLF
jgi:DNA-binding NarL/FixJ family response regulator